MENEHLNQVELNVPLSGSQLFDINAYVTAKNEARAKFTPKSVKAAAEKKRK